MKTVLFPYTNEDIPNHSIQSPGWFGLDPRPNLEQIMAARPRDDFRLVRTGPNIASFLELRRQLAPPGPHEVRVWEGKLSRESHEQ